MWHIEWQPQVISPPVPLLGGDSPQAWLRLYFVPPPSPYAGRSCARHMSPLSPTVRGSVPSTRCRGAHGCPASGAGCSPRGAVLGLPGGIASPKSSCGERKAGMSRAEPARGVWDKLSGLGVADEMGRGRLSLQGNGGLQRWALHWQLGQGWGQVTLLPVTTGTPGNPRYFCPQGTDKHEGGSTRAGPPRGQGIPRAAQPGPLGDSGVWPRDSARASGHEEWVCLSPH